MIARSWYVDIRLAWLLRCPTILAKSQNAFGTRRVDSRLSTVSATLVMVAESGGWSHGPTYTGENVGRYQAGILRTRYRILCGERAASARYSVFPCGAL